MSTAHLLALHRGLNLTLPRYRVLSTFFRNDWEKCFNAPESDWRQSGLDKPGIYKWFSQPKPVPEKELKLIKKAEAKVLIHGEPDYPIALQHTPQAPALLFVRGNISEIDWPSLAVVGSRRLSPYGAQALEECLTAVAQAKIPIVSGLAYGADTVAHKTALKHGAPTVAVLGCGIDEIYPQSNQQLAEEILRKGAVISEFLPKTKARPEYFPVRNRIIAGLTQATLVVEGTKKSGSLITAKYAADYGREVLAIPGDIFRPNAGGTNQLIADGAHLVSGPEKILDVLGCQASVHRPKLPLPTDPISSEILACFGDEKTQHIDQLIRLSKRPSHEVLAQIATLEMQGLVKNLGQQTYRSLI